MYPSNDLSIIGDGINVGDLRPLQESIKITHVEDPSSTTFSKWMNLCGSLESIWRCNGEGEVYSCQCQRKLHYIWQSLERL